MEIELLILMKLLVMKKFFWPGYVMNIFQNTSIPFLQIGELGLPLWSTPLQFIEEFLSFQIRGSDIQTRVRMQTVTVHQNHPHVVWRSEPAVGGKATQQHLKKKHGKVLIEENKAYKLPVCAKLSRFKNKKNMREVLLYSEHMDRPNYNTHQKGGDLCT